MPPVVTAEEMARRLALHEENLAKAGCLPHLKDCCRISGGCDLWVFGYGSLMWNPGFPHLETRVALLRGFHRRFCILSHRYRGTPEAPGLVLGLDRGGSCRGLAFRVPAAEVPCALEYLHEREMTTRVYEPRLVPLATDGGEVRALAFVVDRNHSQYVRLSADETAQIIAEAAGQRGPCSEYLGNTVRHLEALGVGAGALKPLLHLVERRCGEVRRRADHG